MKEYKGIELGLFVDVRDECCDIRSGKLFLLHDDTDKTMKKSLCKVRITDMRGVSFYVRGNPKINSKILLFTSSNNGDYHILEDVFWEEKGDKDIFYYFDLGHFLMKRKVDFQVCMVSKHRIYVKSQKCFERTLYLQKKGFFYKDKSGWDFNYAPGMVTYGKKRISELIVESFDGKFLETDTFTHCVRGCQKVTRLDEDSLLKKIIENTNVNQVQLVMEELHIRLWKEPIGMVTIDYVPPGRGRPKRLCLHERDLKCLDIVDEILKFEKDDEDDFEYR